MNKKGFTLVEILSVLVLIGLLLGLAIPGINKISSNMKKKSYNKKISLVESAAELWGQDNKTLLQSSSDCEISNGEKVSCYKIKIGDLISDNYLDSDNNSGNYINPTNNSDMKNSCVYVYKQNNRVYAEYSKNDNECNNKSEKINPDICLDDTNDGKKVIDIFSDQQYLSYQILCNSKKKLNGTKWTSEPETTPGKVIDQNEKTLSETQDNYGTSYYYRGNVIDNYVNFNNMCWRIVRIEGDGSIKLATASIFGECETSELTNVSGEISIDQKDYEKFDLELNNEHLLEMINEKESDELLNKWFNNFFDENTKKKLKEDVWYLNDDTNFYKETGEVVKCNGECTEDDKTKLVSDNGDLYYADGYRIFIKEKVSMRYDDTYKKIYSFVGALTPDEVVFSGVSISKGGKYCFLNENVNKSYSSFYSKINNYGGIGTADSRFYWNQSEGLNSGRENRLKKLRPSITLKSDSKVLKGDGTKENPYTLKLN